MVRIGFKVDQLAGQVADRARDSTPDATTFLLRKPWLMRLFGQAAVPADQQAAWIERMTAA